MDIELLARRLATGLARVAVAVHSSGEPLEMPRTLAEQQILLLLARRRPEYPLRRLANELGMTTSDLMTALARLSREGLVSMQPAPSYSPDEMQVALTERGLDQAPAVRHWAADLLAAVDDLQLDDQVRLFEVVRRHIQLLQRRGQIPVTRMCVTCRFFDGYAHPGSAAPHHCRLVDAPFGHRELRLRCPEQVAS